MSTLHMPERPVFNSLEPGLDTDLTPPISPLSVIAMVLGIFSLTAALTISVVPFAIIVAVLCAILTWKLSGDPTIGGVRLAQIGLCCAVMGSTWGLTTTQLTKSLYFSHAGENAKLFLQMLSAGKPFEAFELTQPEASRQVTGTDVEAHYQGLMKEASKMSASAKSAAEDNMRGPSVSDKVEDFLASVTTKEIMSHGKDAKWNFVRGVDIVRVNSHTNRVTVVMVDSVDPAKQFHVSMNRSVGQIVSKPGISSIATWEVDKVSAAKE